MISSTITKQAAKPDLFYTEHSIWISWSQFIVGIVIYAMSYYIFNHSAADWDNSIFGRRVMAETIFATFLLPVGLIGWFQPLSRLLTHVPFRFSGVFIICVCTIAALFTIGIMYFFEWQVYNWLVWDLSLNTPIRMVQGIYLTLTLWLTGITLVCILIRMVLHKSLFNNDDGCIPISKEAVPLIHSITSEYQFRFISLFL